MLLAAFTATAAGLNSFVKRGGATTVRASLAENGIVLALVPLALLTLVPGDRPTTLKEMVQVAPGAREIPKKATEVSGGFCGVSIGGEQPTELKPTGLATAIKPAGKASVKPIDVTF